MFTLVFYKIELRTDEDIILINALSRNDERALNEIYNVYWIKLLSIANNRLENDADAEECVQDVFLSLWRNRHTLQITHSLNAYLSAAVKNQVLNRFAKRYTKKHKINYQAEQITYESADSRLLERDLFLTFEAAIKELPKKCQMVFRMSKLESKSNAIIAEELNLSQKTIEGHLTKAIRSIRKRLSSDKLFMMYSLLTWYIQFRTKK